MIVINIGDGDYEYENYGYDYSSTDMPSITTTAPLVYSSELTLKGRCPTLSGKNMEWANPEMVQQNLADSYELAQNCHHHNENNNTMTNNNNNNTAIHQAALALNQTDNSTDGPFHLGIWNEITNDTKTAISKVKTYIVNFEDKYLKNYTIPTISPISNSTNSTTLETGKQSRHLYDHWTKKVREGEAQGPNSDNPQVDAKCGDKRDHSFKCADMTEIDPGRNNFNNSTSSNMETLKNQNIVPVYSCQQLDGNSFRPKLSLLAKNPSEVNPETIKSLTQASYRNLEQMGLPSTMIEEMQNRNHC